MAVEFHVNVEDLVTSAVTTIGHGEHLAAVHMTADSRIAAAESGWTGKSAVALSGRAARWNVKSTELVSRIGDHATAMHASAHRFSAEDTETKSGMVAICPSGSRAVPEL